MRPALLLGLAISFGCGCTNGTAETDISELHDGGPDAHPLVILDGGGDPATPPDGASRCPQGVCNYQTGVGCSGATPACVPALDGQGVAPACEPAGAATNGAACAKTSDCVAGYLCTGEKTCHKLCCGGDWSGCPSANEHCISTLAYSQSDGGVLQTGAMLCYPVNTCDALAPASCSGAGTTCQIVDPTGATACFPEGAGSAGKACPCKGGFTCIVGASGPTCRRLCKAVEGGGSPFCQSGEGACVHFTRDPAGVGECTP